MKKFNYITKSGVLMLLIALSFAACTEKNDWDVDSSYDRLFAITKMDISPDETEAKLTWTGNSKIEYYIIEVSKDTLYDDIAMGASASSIIYGEDKSVTESPFTLTGLDSSSKYFLRAKGMSSSIKESKWSYITDYSFKTKAEQILDVIGSADITAFTVTLRWTSGASATHIDVLKGTEVIKTVALTASDLAAATITIDGLEESTKYTVNIRNNDVVRGTATFTTTPDVPSADLVVFLTETDVLDQDFFDALAGNSTVTIALPGDLAYRGTAVINLPDNVSITFFGLPGENKPVLAIKQFNLASNHDFIKFEGLDISGDNNGNGAVSDYLFNQTDATTVGSIEFKNCFMHGFKNTPLIRLQGSAAKTIEDFIVNDCIVYGAEARTYSLVHVDASSGAGKIENITFTNSTVAYTGKSFVYAKNTNFTSLTVRDCTFSKIIGAGDYLLDCNGTAYGPTTVVLENSIFGSVVDKTNAKGNRSKATPTIINCYTTSDWALTGNSISGFNSYSTGEAGLFANPTNRDFTIIDNSFSEKRSCGDPRWYMPE